jgi:phosphatidylinositol alpha-1,6-mannosyltransferase
MTPEKGARTPKGAEPALGQRASGSSRLLFVSVGLSPHGGGIASASRLVLRVVREWAAERDVELRLFTLGGADELPSGIEGRAFDGDRRALARAVWAAQFREGFRHHVYDHLGIARIQGVLPQAMCARYLLYVYGIEVWRRLRGTRRRALEGAAVRLACSSHTVARLVKHNPFAPEVAPLHLAVEPDGGIGDGLDERLLAAAGDAFVLIVGRLDEDRYKGHDDLIEAVARLAPHHSDLRLVVAGEGKDRGRLERLAALCGVQDRVFFTGFVQEGTLRALYSRCSVFAMPSEGEGFGLVYLEAMRAGKPCVALQGSAAAEVIVDGVTGRLVAAGPESLAEALHRLMSDPASTSAMGVAGRARWQEHFRPERFAAALRPRLDTLMDGKRA